MHSMTPATDKLRSLVTFCLLIANLKAFEIGDFSPAQEDLATDDHQTVHSFTHAGRDGM